MKWYIQGLVFGYLSAPQRTGRLGRGLEMGDGHQDAPCNWGCLGSLDRACGSSSSSSSSQMCVASLALEELASSNCVGVPSLEVLVLRIVLKSGSRTGSSRSTRPQLDRVEFPLFGLDRVRWSSWSVWPWKSSSFSACCLLLPLARKKRLCEALGQGASLGGEE
ncbi:unnamed protein product [Microthlaspi erraticum]|uniref:Uncharacterized protein n=1 Tax=Microthlaspi erraticum TaxID=1685480 RepID=A0A6D2K1D7_9BRAS|nr:unnamed protein product [Microthlaspi erraticum]